MGVQVLQLFDLSYATMLSMLVNVMSNSNVVVDNRLGKLFNLAIDLMIGVMKPVGQLLMTLPSGHQHHHHYHHHHHHHH